MTKCTYHKGYPSNQNSNVFFLCSFVKEPFPQIAYLSLKCGELDSTHVTNITFSPFWGLTKTGYNDEQTIASIWRESMLGYLSVNSMCSKTRTDFQECSSRKTVSYKDQIMSKDKYSSIFSLQMEAIVFIILQIFFAMHKVFRKLGNILGYSQVLAVGIFGYVTCLDQ